MLPFLSFRNQLPHQLNVLGDIMPCSQNEIENKSTNAASEPVFSTNNELSNLLLKVSLHQVISSEKKQKRGFFTFSLIILIALN